MPLVGDGAGDTGIKSMRFGDEDADFSKSLSLWGHKVTTGGGNIFIHINCSVGGERWVREKQLSRSMLESYTTDSA